MKVICGADILDKTNFHLFPNLVLGYEKGINLEPTTIGIALVWGIWFTGVAIEYK